MEEEKPKTFEERVRELDRGTLDKIGEAARLNTRGAGLHRLEDSNVWCPLCHEKMELRVDTTKLLAITPPKVLVCHRCRIGIHADDPFVDKWEPPGSQPIECPVCESPMRFFCTSTGYWRAECWATLGKGPKGTRRCGATLSLAQPDRKPGAYVEGQPQETGIDRPVAPNEMVLPDPTVGQDLPPEEGRA